MALLVLQGLVLLGLYRIRAVDIITAVNVTGWRTLNPAGQLMIAIRIMLALLKMRMCKLRAIRDTDTEEDQHQQSFELLSMLIYGAAELAIACISVLVLFPWEWDSALLLFAPFSFTAAAVILDMEPWVMLVGELLLAASELYQPPFKSKWVGIPYMVAGFANAKLGAAIPAFVRIPAPWHALLECGLLPSIVAVGGVIFATGFWGLILAAGFCINSGRLSL